MNSPAIRSLTFDLDGTLLDTLPDLAAAANAMLAELGRPPLPPAAIAGFIGHGTTNLVARCLPEDIDATALADAEDIFGRHYAVENGRRSQPFPGVVAALDQFAEAGLPLAVVTNKPARFSEPLLAATGLMDFFRFVICGDTLAEKKPHPLPLLHACQRFGVTPAENLHIGDSRHDAAAARAAGCPVWLLPHGYNAGEPVRAADCDAIVASFDELARRVLTALSAVSPAPTF
uniref:Phosphoglycolate phosphatase n=1 Tax=uncultured bacterium UPO50 TaxID=1776975 RepID=A0A126SYB8_9BACT|nr:phosphoglycolate phosphatase [uncultured bacterium UPO50]